MPVGRPRFARRCARAPRCFTRSRSCCTSEGYSTASATRAASRRPAVATRRRWRVSWRRSRRPATSPARSGAGARRRRRELWDKTTKYVFKLEGESKELRRQRDGRVLREAVREVSDRLDRGRPGRERLGRLEAADQGTRRARAARRRRSVRDQHQTPRARASRRRRQRDPDQGQPDRHAHRDAGRDRAGPPQRLDRRSSRIARARPRTPSSPISPCGMRSGQIKTASRRAPNASPSTIACCASRKSSARRRCGAAAGPPQAASGDQGPRKGEGARRALAPPPSNSIPCPAKRGRAREGGRRALAFQPTSPRAGSGR